MSVVVRARPATAFFTTEAPSSWPTRRALQIVLGIVWLLDAVLQFQPYMFSSSFVTKTIEPTAAGNPGLIAGPIIWSAHLMAHHIVLCNAAFATIQLVIAAGFFSRRTVKIALAASIVWAAFVWWFGEGLGGILSGGSPLAGVPGAVLLYALIALLLWPAPQGPDDPALAPALRGPLGRVVPRLAWVVLWGGFGWYLLLPGNRAPNAVSQVFTGAVGQASWIRPVESSLASITSGHGLAASLVIWVLCDLVGLAILADRLVRPALVLACLLGLLFWVSEGFGGLATGQATDPNSGPLLILLAACFWPPAHRETGASV